MKNLIFAIIIILSITLTAGCIAEEETAIEAGHIHITRRGDSRAEMLSFIEEASNNELSVRGSCAGELRTYLELAINRGSIERGTLFTHGHIDVHRLFEDARPFVEALPERYIVREEFSELADPTGKLHLVWVDAFVIIYNPEQINRENVPNTWSYLAEFEQGIALPTKGCIGSWGTIALYYHLGEEKFTTLIDNTQVDSKIRPTVSAVVNGIVPIGVAHLLDPRVKNGEVGVIWPKDGAIARPAFMIIPKNPTEYHLRLADILMSQDAAKLYANEFNVASSLPNGPAPDIIIKNDFNFIYIPSTAIMCDEKNRQVIEIL
ncbi:MAG: ABC transporter substrate-binding protein [Methanosarcinales archaeon]|nr:ABC transporter substrate-binding protein [Methanosarcinales archaeon]